MKRIFIFGDSNTWGMIPRSDDRYPWDVRWTGRLQRKVLDKDVWLIDEAHNGRTTVFEDPFWPNRRGIDYLPMLLESHTPFEAAVLMLGTNDCKVYFNATAEIIGMGLEKCLDLISEYVHAQKILLISPIRVGNRVTAEDGDPAFDAASIEKSHGLKRVCAEIAERRGLAFLSAADYAVPSPVDGIHMTAEGHAALADAIFDKLTEMGVL